MRRLVAGGLMVAVALMASLSGCLATQEAKGLCDPVFPLLLASGTVNTPDPPTSLWTIVWPDGRTEAWAVEESLDWGIEEASTVVTHGDLDPKVACGVAAFHGAYPGPDWPPRGFPAEPLQAHLDIARESVAHADPAPLAAVLERTFFTLPEDASLPGCADGITLTFSAHVAGETHRSRAHCQGTPEFEEFAAFVRAWTDGAR